MYTDYYCLSHLCENLSITSILLITSTDKYYNNYKYHYLYKKPIVYLYYPQIINNCVKNPNYLIIIPQIKGKQIEELAYKGYNIYGINCDYYTGKINHLPNSLKILNLYNYVDDWKLKIPDSVEFIDYGYSKDSIDKYPKNLKYLNLKHTKNIKIPNSCNLLETLLLGTFFNEPINNKIQYSIKKLNLGYSFDHSIDKLPQSLKSLEIQGETFNQSFDKLPQSLKSLKINGKKFI